MGHIVNDYRDELEEMVVDYLKDLYLTLESAEDPKQQLIIMKDIIRNKGDIPEIKKYLESEDKNVRTEAYKYMYKNEDLNIYKDYILKGFVSNYDQIRKLSFDWFAEDYNYGTSSVVESITDEKVFDYFLKEYNSRNQISFIKKFIKSADDENIKKLMEITKNKINVEAYSLFELSENYKNILKDKASPKDTIKEAAEWIVENSPVDFLIDFLEQSDNQLARREVSKKMANKSSGLTGVDLKEIISFLDEEEDLDVSVNLMKLSKKIYKTEGIDIRHIDNLIKSDYSKYQIHGFNFGVSKDIMDYIDYAREILLTSTDENLIYAAAKYLLYFLDYQLTEYIPEFLNSKSKKLKSLAIDIIRKLDLKDFSDKLHSVASKRYNNDSIRRKALSTLINFKAVPYADIFKRIAFDEDESLKLREVALKGVLLFEPALIQK